MKASKKYIVLWLNICCFAISLMIIVGGITRLTQSGLSIVEWKPLTGILPPLNEKQWEESFNQYKLFPEYQKDILYLEKRVIRHIKKLSLLMLSMK